MRIVYLIIGFLSLALAIVGVVLPLLPTTPFSFTIYCLFLQKFQAFRRLALSYQALSGICS